MSRVLVIEDQKRLQNSLRRGLEEDGYEVVSALNGEEGYYLATTQACDVLVLDLMLPGRDGLSILKDLRAHGFKKPVLILTSRDAVEDRVAGLDAGADDYLIKPFSFAELVARLRVMLREVYINSLRKKVEQPDQRQLIHTVRGIGYALRDT